MSSAEKEVKRFGRAIDSGIRDIRTKSRQNIRGFGRAIDKELRGFGAYRGAGDALQKVAGMPDTKDIREKEAAVAAAVEEQTRQEQKNLLKLAEQEDEIAKRGSRLKNRQSGRSLLVGTSQTGAQRTTLG